MSFQNLSVFLHPDINYYNNLSQKRLQSAVLYSEHLREKPSSTVHYSYSVSTGARVHTVFSSTAKGSHHKNKQEKVGHCPTFDFF